MASLKLKPYSSPLKDTKDIAYEISGLDPAKEYRISLENATHNVKLSSSQAVAGSATAGGKLDLKIPEHSENAIVSVFANIEEKVLGGWRLAEISAFSFQIENSKTRHTSDRISVYPPFVGPSDVATIQVDSANPKSVVNVNINGKVFRVRTNYNGHGTMSFRGLDVISGSTVGFEVMQKFPISFSSSSDDFASTYDAGGFVHFVPEAIKALQATNDPTAPACAIIDPDPGPGLSLRSLDEFCFEGAVVGPYSVFTEDEFINSHVGYCTDVSEISAAPDACRIYNSTASTILPNGAGLVVFSSQTNEAAAACDEVTLASRVYIAHIPTSLKYQGNPVRDVSILKPPQFYHSVTIDSVADGETIGITFRFEEDNEVFEIQYVATSSDEEEALAGLATAINADSRIIEREVTAVVTGGRLDIYSENRFSIVVTSSAGSDISACLHSNQTLEVIVPEIAFTDLGSTLLFLTPPLGAQVYQIESKVEPDLFRIFVPEGVNNGIGPTVRENIYCQKVVVLNTSVEQTNFSSLDTGGVASVNPLPFIKDGEGRELPSVYPVVAARRERIDGQTFVYVVCQAPVDGIYQLFFYSFEVGDIVFKNEQWVQITTEGENKNAKMSCDSAGNLHLVWESDRTGITQVYYGVLGPGSRMIANQVLMSAASKEATAELAGSLFDISTPTASFTPTWKSLYTGSGSATSGSATNVVVTTNPSDDGALAATSLTADEFGFGFDGKFAQLSYQLSFDLTTSGLPTEALDDHDIEALFKVWKQQFIAYSKYRYLYQNNIMSLNRYELYFDNIIPIAGSYKIDLPVSSPSETETEAVLAHGANIRHFVLAIMPEKYRFKAVNTEPLFGFCERNELSAANCSGYVDKIENVGYTGRYKLALVMSTSEDESTGAVAQKKFHVLRQIGDYFDLSASRNFKIAVHYSKASTDFIDWKLRLDDKAYPQDYRYYADILVALDDAVVAGESFIADFSDQYRSFQIGLGVPSGGGYLTKELLPYNGNRYDDVDVVLTYNNVVIGPHSIATSDTFVSFNPYDRLTSQMVSNDFGPANLVLNPSFEDSTLPIQSLSYPITGSSGIDSWTVLAPVTYATVQAGVAAQGVNVIGLSGYESGNGTGPATKGKIRQALTLEIGKNYSLFFSISPQPTSSSVGQNVTRTVTADIDTANESFTTLSDASNEYKWIRHRVDFTASATSVTLEFENTTAGSAEYPPYIDNIVLVPTDELNDELDSNSTASYLGLTNDEFYLNYSLDYPGSLTQIPVTLSTSAQNRNPALFVDAFDKVHVAWQSNRDGDWDIYYSGFRDRSIPFRYETRITSSRGNSIYPTVTVDDKGRRLIAWQDNRNGNYQIYSAVCRSFDPSWIDPCKIDEANIFVRTVNAAFQEYDPYAIMTETMGCQVVFDFEAPFSGTFHFVLKFFTDSEMENLYKKVSSRTDLSGWRINDRQVEHDGRSLTNGESVRVTYDVSREDDLTDQVYYLVATYESSRPGDVVNAGGSSLLSIIDPEPGLDFGSGGLESNTQVSIVTEYRGASPLDFAEEDATYFIDRGGTTPGVVFSGNLQSLPGTALGDDISVLYVHWDPVGSPAGATISNVVIALNEPIVAIVYKRADLNTTDPHFGLSIATYPTGSLFERGLEFGPTDGDLMTISEDRLTLTINNLMVGNASVDSFRIITKPLSDTAIAAEFAFYCPYDQSSRCNVVVPFSNNDETEKVVHFRTTFFADPARTSVILSSFSLVDPRNWMSGEGTFPTSGITVDAGQTISVSFDPEILPFEFYDHQNTVAGADKQSLLCGVTYYTRVESFYSQSFHVEEESVFICPCAYTDSYVAGRNSDARNWVCGAQGKQDFRISNVQAQSIRPNAVAGNNGVFYIVWEDYRYTGALEGQPSLSPDYFMALWVPDSEKFYCSGQGDFDRRVTSFEDDGVLHDASLIIDPFQNITSVWHNGKKVFAKSCSIGCVLEAFNPEILEPCMFTDSTRARDADFFVVGGAPDRDVRAYMLMRIKQGYVKYSTYVDLETPISVVDDCFMELDIIGVPGTYAYRLRNEDDDDWTEWLPINDDLPEQPTDEETTATEREFFRAYFVGRDRFIAPWIASPGNGKKRVCCEILTFFGKTEQFCLDFMALYKDLEYSIDLYFEDGTPVPKYNSYPVVSTKKTTTPITPEDLRSIAEESEPTDVSSIKVVVNIKDKEKLELIKKMRELERYSYLRDISMSVYQQGLNDQLNIALEEGEEAGTFTGSFSVAKHDGVVNIDGLSVIVINLPGQCKPYTNEDIFNRLARLQEPKHLEQTATMFDNFTVFRDKYNADDLRGSFGDVDYYRKRAFGGGIVGGSVGTGGVGTGGGGDVGSNGPTGGGTGGTVGGGNGSGGNGGWSGGGNNQSSGG